MGEAASHWSIRSNAVVALPPLNMALARYMVIQALAEGKILAKMLEKKPMGTPEVKLTLASCLTPGAVPRGAREFCITRTWQAL